VRDDQGIRPDPPVNDPAFDPGFAIRPTADPLGFAYGGGVFGPEPEPRRLDAIRRSLRDPDCTGPDPVYAIVMDVGRDEHREELQRRFLLYGAVTYAAGRLGEEPVRSQGHVHAVAPHSGWRPPEVYEIWSGRAIVYVQEHVADDPGRCLAVEAGPGDVVVVPPGWVHATLSADPARQLTFGAWCDREYGFEYEGVRARRGLAHYAVVAADGGLEWRSNPRYRERPLVTRPTRAYPELGLRPGVPVYEQFADDPESVQWVSDPARLARLWPEFEP
jgi:glucose-6-phosphate isomerase